MKSIKTTTLLSLTILCSLIFSNESCTVQKRSYNKGYFVKWNLNKKVSENKNPEETLVSEDFIQNESIESVVYLEENQVTELVSTSSSTEVKNELIEDNLVEFETENKVENSTFKVKQSKQLKKDNLSIRNVKSLKKESKRAYFNWDLGINILLTVVFLGLAILFLILALNAVMPTILIWGILGLISLILFITQVIDLINY